MGLYGESNIESEEYTRYVICKEMGWDYYTYQAQPPFFIEEVLLVMNQEAQFNKRESKKAKRMAEGPRAVKPKRR